MVTLIVNKSLKQQTISGIFKIHNKPEVRRHILNQLKMLFVTVYYSKSNVQIRGKESM